MGKPLYLKSYLVNSFECLDRNGLLRCPFADKFYELIRFMLNTGNTLCIMCTYSFGNNTRGPTSLSSVHIACSRLSYGGEKRVKPWQKANGATLGQGYWGRGSARPSLAWFASYHGFISFFLSTFREPGTGSRGVYSTGIWVGGFGWLDKTLTLFKTQKM